MLEWLPLWVRAHPVWERCWPSRRWGMTFLLYPARLCSWGKGSRGVAESGVWVKGGSVCCHITILLFFKPRHQKVFLCRFIPVVILNLHTYTSASSNVHLPLFISTLERLCKSCVASTSCCRWIYCSNRLSTLTSCCQLWLFTCNPWPFSAFFMPDQVKTRWPRMLWFTSPPTASGHKLALPI